MFDPSRLSKYSKAYFVRDLRRFPGWTEKLENLQPENPNRTTTQIWDGEEVKVPRPTLEDDDFLYLHDSYIVTDGVHKDEYVIFDAVTEEWKRFCHQELGFDPDLS